MITRPTWMRVYAFVTTGWSARLTLGLLGMAMILMLPPDAAGEPIRSNVLKAELGSAQSSVEVRILETPYFFGERLKISITVRNITQSAARLLPPRALFVGMGEQGSTLAGHRCLYHLGSFDNISLGQLECIRQLREKLIVFKPGQEMSASWISPPLAPREGGADETSTHDATTFIFSHDILPTLSLTVRLYPHREPIWGQVAVAGRGFRKFAWAAEAWPAEYLILEMGSWYSHESPPAQFDAAWLNRQVEFQEPRRLGGVYSSMPDLVIATDGSLLIDGMPAPEPRLERFQNTDDRFGWLADKPTQDDDDDHGRGDRHDRDDDERERDDSNGKRPDSRERDR